MNMHSWRVSLLLPISLLLLGCPGPRKPAQAAAETVSGERAPTTSSASTNKAASAEWFRWRGPNLTGISPDTNWNPVFPEDGPKQVWKASVGIGFSSISVSKGRVYTMGHSDKKDTVYCLDLATGKELWTHSYDQELDPKYYEGGPSATPTVDGEAVYTLSKTGDIFCFDAASGKVIWSKNLSKELGAKIPTWGFASSVLIHDQMAVVNVGTFGTALDKNNGTVLWKTGKDAAGYATPVPFKNGNTAAFMIFGGDSLAAIKAEDGSVLWQHPWKTSYDVNVADPIITNNTVFISSGYGTGCALIDFSSGKPKEV